jgi:hypothetical protein
VATGGVADCDEDNCAQGERRHQGASRAPQGRAGYDARMFAVLLTLTVTVAQPTYDFGESIFEDGTVAFTAVLKNVSRGSLRVCTDSLESVRVARLTVDGEAVAPSAPERELEIAPPPETARAALYAGATVDLRVAALLADGPRGARLVFKPAGRGLYKVQLEYRCAGIKGAVRSNTVSFRVH